MTLNRVSEYYVSSWLEISNMWKIIIIFHVLSDIVFLSGGNPYEALEFM